MAAPAILKRLAVDSNILFDLAAESDFAHTFIEVFQERGYSIKVPPTAIQEVTFIAFERPARTATEISERGLACIALKKMLSWGLMPFDLIPVGHGITEQFVNKLQNLGHLPDDEFNDGLILAETSLACVPVLLTNDTHLTSIDSTQLRICFESADLMPVIVTRPGTMLRAVR